MTLKQTKQRGFTIVELLIVVVIIAILAAITIVAYNGIQNRAKTTAAAGAASTLQKKSEAYFTGSTANAYPSDPSVLWSAPTTTNDIWYMPADAVIVGTPGASANEKTISYVSCNSGAGYYINYWDYSTPGRKTISGGNTASCTNP